MCLSKRDDVYAASPTRNCSTYIYAGIYSMYSSIYCIYYIQYLLRRCSAVPGTVWREAIYVQYIQVCACIICKMPFTEFKHTGVAVVSVPSRAFPIGSYEAMPDLCVSNACLLYCTEYTKWRSTRDSSPGSTFWTVGLLTASTPKPGNTKETEAAKFSLSEWTSVRPTRIQ